MCLLPFWFSRIAVLYMLVVSQIHGYKYDDLDDLGWPWLPWLGTRSLWKSLLVKDERPKYESFVSWRNVGNDLCPCWRDVINNIPSLFIDKSNMTIYAVYGWPNTHKTKREILISVWLLTCSIIHGHECDLLVILISVTLSQAHCTTNTSKAYQRKISCWCIQLWIIRAMKKF